MAPADGAIVSPEEKGPRKPGPRRCIGCSECFAKLWGARLWWREHPAEAVAGYAAVMAREPLLFGQSTTGAPS